MVVRRFLTQKELEDELEAAVADLEHDVILDAVYVPPNVDYLTDEEGIDSETIGPENQPTSSDIAGTFELHNLEQHFEDESALDSSDEVLLSDKRQKLLDQLPKNNTSKVQWRKKNIAYTHSPVSIEIEDIQTIRDQLAVKLAKRYNRKEKKEIQISQPNVIAEYNKSMGGVDLHDNGIANYRCRNKNIPNNSQQQSQHVVSTVIATTWPQLLDCAGFKDAQNVADLLDI
ncbi:uncharacterized protein LOC135129951 [Zophobas morio]|uniref:uncharacterized protein LOC135129951 n=1 Tax=Zophobas morio TaxID=2755281 RepID=UPI0030837779